MILKQLFLCPRGKILQEDNQTEYKAVLSHFQMQGIISTLSLCPYLHLISYAGGGGIFISTRNRYPIKFFQKQSVLTFRKN